MSIWAGQKVFITGHTGFKGSWLSLWLANLGAEVTGYALAPNTEPSLFELARVQERVKHIVGDVRDLPSMEAAMRAAAPSVVFHLAAQPLVRLSYDEPVDTFSTNVMGTVNVLDAVRRLPTCRAVIAVTSDKCYENREWEWAYRENEPMGGYDPYSASKGASELVISAYRRSYFQPPGSAGVASVRAGNVIGGGDWAKDRLIPDIVRALGAGGLPVIRSPDSVRPWQHVLEALGGYIDIAERLLAGERKFAESWNFGPSDDDTRPVRWIVERMLEKWGASQGWHFPDNEQPHEAHLLRLDCSKARAAMGWRPRFNLGTALDRIVEWHQQVGGGADAQAVTLAQIHEYRMRTTDGSAHMIDAQPDDQFR